MAVKEETKLIVVNTIGSISALGGISGPIINPQRMPMSKVLALVSSKVNVYEVNPKNTKERVKLTVMNVRKNNFPEEEEYVKPEPPKVINSKNKYKIKKEDETTPVTEASSDFTSTN